MKKKQVNAVNTPIHRRVLLKSAVFSGVSLSVLPRSWTKPVVNSVLLPAHAQTSDVPDPALVCPVVTFGSGTFSAGSAPGTCGLSFQFLSGDAGVPVDIISITNSVLVGTDQVTYSNGTSGTATATSGLTANWVGQSIGAPFACAADAPVPINDVTFTVTYNCADNPTLLTMTFSLSAIAASL